MTSDSQQLEFIWRGEETIRQVQPLIGTAERIEIELPANYNHALFSRFHPDSAPDELEQLDIRGDAHLLGDIAEIKGLEAIAALVQRARETAASVRLISPPRVVIESASALADPPP